MKSRIRKKIVDRLAGLKGEEGENPYHYKQVLRAYGIGYLSSVMDRNTGWVYFRPSALRFYPQLGKKVTEAFYRNKKKRKEIAIQCQKLGIWREKNVH